MHEPTRWVVGAMTGTSLDGLDVALVRITGRGRAMRGKLVAHEASPLEQLGEELKQLACGEPRSAAAFLRAARELGQLHAQIIAAMCQRHLPRHARLNFVAAHGQTICHMPEQNLSWQLLDPWPMVRELNTPVVYDLRQADLIAGGQGAPITPLADPILYGHSSTLLFNLGGICNYTFWDGPAMQGAIGGGDIGVCNILLDGLVQRLYPGQRFDLDGALAANGRASDSLVQHIQNAIVEASGQAATFGREQFGRPFLDRVLAQTGANTPAEDVLACAVQAVADRIGQVVANHRAERVILAGGGARNHTLVQAIRNTLSDATGCCTSEQCGIACEAREAAAMAVLGAVCEDGTPITLSEVTGSDRPGVAGTWAGLKPNGSRIGQTHDLSHQQGVSNQPIREESPAPGRGSLPTEQRLDASSALDAIPLEQVLKLMNEQDQQVPEVIGEAIQDIAAVAEAAKTALEQNGRLIYIGAGTSGRLGALDAAECPPTFHSDPEQILGVIAGGDAALRQAVEGAEDDEDAGRRVAQQMQFSAQDMVVGIAAGGTTPYVWAALHAAKHRGATTALLTCVPIDQVLACRGSDDGATLDHAIELPVGPEVVTGSTRLKAGTATKLALNMISTATFVQLGKTWGNLMIDLKVSNAKLHERALRILGEQADMDVDQASTLLDQAGGRVKLALIMGRLDLDATQAQRRLDETRGQLRPLLGPPRDNAAARSRQ